MRPKVRVHHISLMLRSCALLGGLVCAQQAMATHETWEWSGFVSQAGVYTSDNNYFGDTDDKLSGSYGETGVIVKGAVFETVDFSAQVIARRAGELDDGTPRFDYANLSYRFLENLHSTNEVRVGKLKAPIGLYNETREVPFTRPGIFVPQGIYWEKVRNTRSFFDGAQYFHEYNHDLSVFSLRVGAGEVRADQQEFESLMGIENFFSIAPLDTRQFSVGHDYDGGRIRTNYTYSEFKSRIFPADQSQDFLYGQGRLEYSFNVFSFEYNTADWSLTAEMMRGKTLTGFSSAFFSTYVEHPESSYCQFTYRATESLEYFVRYEHQRADREDPSGSNYIHTVFTPLEPILPLLGVESSPTHTRYSYDRTVGIAWRPSVDLLLRAEWHRVTGTSEVANYLFNKNKLTKEWDLAAIQVSYRFK